MRKFAVAIIVAVAVTVAGLNADPIGKSPAVAKKAVAALPPHPLDKAFEKAKDADGLSKALARSDLFDKAVKAALKAKKEQEERYKKERFVGPTPAQAARLAFLKVLRDGK